MASLMLSNASSSVSPCETHPLRVGQDTTYPPASGSCSMTMGYSIYTSRSTMRRIIAERERNVRRDTPFDRSRFARARSLRPAESYEAALLPADKELWSL